jgi:LPPG:FO 2-phospho-L-lactate transferase
LLRSIACLAGGVGAARFLDGLTKVYPPEKITVIVNTGDDLDYLGVHISPDLDIVTYTLAGIVDKEKGYGIEGDTYNCMAQLERYKAETWFRIGDRDFATHLLRTAFLQQGFTMSELTEKIRSLLGVKVRILPMSDQMIATKIKTANGQLDFQEYFVKRKFEDNVEDVSYEGATVAKPAPGVAESIERSDAVILCPSNPILSIGPILAVPGIRNSLAKTKARILGISPIVGGKSIKGPLDRIMRHLGLDVSPLGVALLYKGLLKGFVIDEIDKAIAPKINGLGMKVVMTQTIMDSTVARARLAENTLRLAETL